MMRNFFKAAPRKQKFQHSLRIEPLETRNLLTATLTSSLQLSGGVFAVGTSDTSTFNPGAVVLGSNTGNATLNEGISNLANFTGAATINCGTLTISGNGGLNYGHIPPSGTDKTITTPPESPYTFAESDFGFQSLYSFTRVMITTVPASGSLLLVDSPVTAGQFITVEDLAAGRLKYLSAAGAAAHPTLTFQVEDNGSTDPDLNFDPTPNTITFNKAPVAQDDAYTVNESETLDQRMIVSNLHMVSQPGDPVGNGQTYDYSDLTSVFSVTRDEHNGIQIILSKTVQLQSGVQLYQSVSRLYFAAANGGVLTPGTYTDVVRPSSQVLDKPSMQISPNFGFGLILSTFTGQFTVNEVVYSDSGEVLSFDATFEQHIGSSGGLISHEPVYNPAALTGRILFHAANPQSVSVLQNDADADGDPLMAVLVAGPQHGTLTLNTDGGFVYTPTPGFNGIDTFQYKANDGSADSNVSTVTIEVVPFSHAPVGTTSIINVPAGPSYTLKTADFGFTDPRDTPADTFTRVQFTSLPSSGVLALDGVLLNTGDFVSAADIAAGKLVLTFDPSRPHPSCTFQVEDSGSTENGGGNFDLVPKSLTFDSMPATQDDSYSINENSTLTVDSSLSLLLNDSDPDGDPLLASIVTNPAHGTLQLELDGTFIYTPDLNFHGVDTFQYQAAGGYLLGNVATVTINVVPPIAVSIEPITELNDITTDSPLHFLAHFSEPVVDFTADDLTLGGTAPGTLKATINPRPTNGSAIYYYDVLVSGMTGSGTVTVSLAAGVVHTVDGISNAAASSAENPIDYLANGVTISGTAGDDIFNFQAGDTPATWKLTVNGQTRVIPADISSLLIDGVSGSDTLSFSGSGEALTAALGYEQGKIYFGTYTFAYLNMDHSSVVGGSGHDVATLQDSAGNDAFQGLPNSAQLTTAGKSIAVQNFHSVSVEATTGHDTAVMYGSPNGDSAYSAYSWNVAFSGAGFYYDLTGFQQVSAYAAPGKNNTADFFRQVVPFESTLQSTSTIEKEYDNPVLLIASYMGAQFIGKGFAYDVWNVNNIQGFGSIGDEARFYGSPGGNTTLNASPSQSLQTEANLTLMATGYSKFSSYVYPGGKSTANIVGSVGNDRAVTSPWGAQLFGSNFELSAWTYKNINLIGNEGHDVVQMYGLDGAAKFEGHGTSASFASGNVTRSVDRFSEIYAHGNAASTATFFAQPGMKNTFDASPTQASMSSAGNPDLAEQTHGLGDMQDAKYGAAYKITALGFGSNTAYGNTGGTDEANYADSAGADYFISSYLGSQMFGQGYSNSAWNFAAMTAASTGGADTARFYGSPSNPDSFVANPTNAKHSGTGYQSEAKNFARVEAYSGLGSGGTAQLTGTSGDDHFVSSPKGAQLWGQGYRIEAWNYASVKTEGAGGNDNANLYGKASNNRLVADNVFAQFSGDGFANRIEHFAKACVYGSTTGSDSAELDHAFFNSGWKDQPDDITSLNILRKLWISDFDEVAVTRKPDDPTPHPQAIDKLMTAFMFE